MDDEDENGEDPAPCYQQTHEATVRPGFAVFVARVLGLCKERGDAPPMDEEREVQHEPQVLEGEDDLPRQPTSHRDPFVPEPGPRPGERRAWGVMRFAWIPIAIAVAIVIWAAIR
jgi:hypothetical protein